MGSRLGLHAILEAIPGVAEAYHQPPESLKLKYPCIVYKLNDIDTKHADDIPYATQKQYKVTVIDKNSDSEIPDAVLQLPLCSFDRPYTTNNLHHTVCRLYF